MLITGVEVFRAICRRSDSGMLAHLSRLPLIDPLLVRGYMRGSPGNRLWLTGRGHRLSELPNGNQAEIDAPH